MVQNLKLETAESIKQFITRSPVLFIRQDESSEDAEARQLVKEELGSTIKVVRRQMNGVDNGAAPELVASGTSYYGLDGIKNFFEYLRSLRDDATEEA